MIVWREKFLATAIHFLVTLTLAAVAAALIFFVWFPDPFQTMIGGTELFMLVVGCDLALGPLLSLVIYNSRKTRRQLVIDYTFVGVVQIAAMIYGIFILSGTRPVYVAFDTDRLEIVSARDITVAELAAAKTPLYRSLPLTGPRYVAVVVAPEDNQDALFQALDGNPELGRPKFYVPYESQLEAIRTRAKTLADLEKTHPEAKLLMDAELARSGIPASRVRWLPVHHFRGFWTALIDERDGRPVGWVDFDPL